MKIKPWTIALFILIIADSIFTTYLGAERNPMIVWFMETFDWSLKKAMIIRLFYCAPFLALLNWKDWSRFTFISYIGIYITFLFF